CRTDFPSCATADYFLIHPCRCLSRGCCGFPALITWSPPRSSRPSSSCTFLGCCIVGGDTRTSRSSRSYRSSSPCTGLPMRSRFFGVVGKLPAIGAVTPSPTLASRNPCTWRSMALRRYFWEQFSPAVFDGHLQPASTYRRADLFADIVE